MDQNHCKRTRIAEDQIPKKAKVFASTGKMALNKHYNEYARDIIEIVSKNRLSRLRIIVE